MKLLKQFPLFIVLIVLFFCLHGVSENYGYISFYETIKTGSIILLVIIFVTTILYIFCKDLVYSSLIVFFASLCYLFFGAIQDALKPYTFVNRYLFLLPLFFLLILVVVFFFKNRKTLQVKVLLFLNLLLLIYCLYDGLMIMGKVVRQQAFTSQKISFNYSVVKNRPNVYFLLFDEYPGYKSLTDSFNFKNDNFYYSLKNDSFCIQPIFSNYNKTPFSMSSILNMQYISGIKNLLIIHQNDLQLRSKEIKNAYVFDAFSQMGYALNNYSLFDVKNQESLGGNSFILGHSRLLTDKLLHNRLIKDLGWIFLSGKYASSLFQRIYYGDVKDYNEIVASNLDKILLNKNSQPQFVYAHFLLPHQPYFYDSTGKANPLENLEDDKTLRNKAIFLSYLKYCNKKILKIKKEIINNDPSGIIILMSDHGFRYYNNNKNFDSLNFNNFCAIRNLKNNNSLINKISNVNIFRYIFNCNFNQRLPYLKDSICVLKDLKR